MGDKPELQDTNFYYPTHNAPERVGTEGAVYGGPYLDDVLRVEAEKLRAIAEDREPDLENASAVAGTPLLTEYAVDPNGVRRGVVPNQVLPVVVGNPEVDDDGNPTGDKSYLESTVKPATTINEDTKKAEETTSAQQETSTKQATVISGGTT
jgi:hypothetical protein